MSALVRVVEDLSRSSSELALEDQILFQNSLSSEDSSDLNVWKFDLGVELLQSE